MNLTWENPCCDMTVLLRGLPRTRGPDICCEGVQGEGHVLELASLSESVSTDKDDATKCCNDDLIMTVSDASRIHSLEKTCKFCVHTSHVIHLLTLSHLQCNMIFQESCNSVQ